MTTFAERQYHPTRILLCTGDEPHACDLPRLRSDGGATGDVRCTQCGEPMMLVDAIIVDRNPTWDMLAFDRGARTYTDARLHPVAVLSALAAASNQDSESEESK